MDSQSKGRPRRANDVPVTSAIAGELTGFSPASAERSIGWAANAAGPLGCVDLSRFDRSAFDRGASRLKEVIWLLVRAMFFEPSWLHANRLKRWLLRAFGATVGCGVVIKPGARIAFPWRLRLGDHVWIGEDAFLLNLLPITIGSNVCISQRVFLCTGNHDYTSAEFTLMASPILVEDGAWIGAAAWVAPGVTVGSHAVLAAGSVATTDLKPYRVYRGNPARPVRRRNVNTGQQLAE